jgi:fructan beta-fructosidase
MKWNNQSAYHAHNQIVGIMTPKKLLSFSLILSIALPVYAQEEKKIPDDPYGISYEEVFDNMHYNQPLRPQVHYTPITG